MQSRTSIWLYAATGVVLASATLCRAAEGAEGLHVGLQLECASYAIGEPVFVLVTLTNRGDKVIKTRLPKRELQGFSLEMAFEDGEFRKIDFRMFLPGHTPFPVREFKPKESIAGSEPILLKPGSQGLVQKEPEKWARALICDQPGKCRIRASVSVPLSDEEGLSVVSEPVEFTVTAAKDGARRFVELAAANFGSGVLQLSADGYKRAKEAYPDLKGTVYGRYVQWSMMKYYALHSMSDREGADLLPEEKQQREEYRRFAESVLSGDRKIWTGYAEAALAFLVEYHVRSGDFEHAMKYAKVLAEKTPWSRFADVASKLQEHLEKSRAKAKQ